MYYTDYFCENGQEMAVSLACCYIYRLMPTGKDGFAKHLHQRENSFKYRVSYSAVFASLSAKRQA